MFPQTKHVNLDMLYVLRTEYVWRAVNLMQMIFSISLVQYATDGSICTKWTIRRASPVARKQKTVLGRTTVMEPISEVIKYTVRTGYLRLCNSATVLMHSFCSCGSRTMGCIQCHPSAERSEKLFSQKNSFQFVQYKIQARR
jgi:hypothetical protein